MGKAGSQSFCSVVVKVIEIITSSICRVLGFFTKYFHTPFLVELCNLIKNISLTHWKGGLV